MRLAIFGALAGLAVGYVLRRGDLCFHALFRGLYERRTALFKAWLLGVALAALGLTAVYAFGPWEQLNRGLPLRPVHNIAGGLMIGVGMVVAASCNSGLYYKLGSGMLGAAVGIAGLGAGELTGSRISLPGPTVLGAGADATLPGVLGVSRWWVAAPLAAVVVGLALLRFRRDEREARRWGWPVTGVTLGVVTAGGWALAGAGGHSFGPSTVGAFAGTAAGAAPWWLIAFLIALVAGAAVASPGSGGLWLRGERASRYVGLVGGGFLLGMGARVAGGCNIGHGLSGMAQLNVSSLVVVGSIVAGLGVARAVQVGVSGARRPEAFVWTALSPRGDG